VKGTMRQMATTWTVMVAAAALLTFLVPAFAGDAEVAKFLLKSGREDLDKGKPNDALTKLEKARTEDPSLIEASYWIGAVHEAKKDPLRALAEYRSFLRGLEAAMRDGTATKELLALEKKARTRVAALDAAGGEISKANAALAQQLMAFATAQVGKDDALAERALRALLRVVPEHAEAAAVLARVTGETSSAQDPLAAVKEWWDLIASRGFGVNDGWTYGGGEILIDPPSHVGKGVLGPAPIVSGPSFVIESEFTLEGIKLATKLPSAGVTFGTIKGSGYGVTIFKERLILQKVGRTGLAEIEAVPMSEYRVGDRHRLVIAVERQRVRAYINGRVRIDRRITDRPHYAGEIGIKHENATLRFHRLRWGNLGAAGVPVETR
jgi:hypothetical protein